MKASKILKMFAATAAIAAVAACEWGAGDDADSWSDSFNWVNFSGVYRTSGTKSVTKTNTKGHEDAETSEGIVTKSESKSEIKTGNALTIYQSGQNLTITDGRNGAIYTGKFKSLRSASGYENTPGTSSATQGRTTSAQSAGLATDTQQGVKTRENHQFPYDGDVVIGSFEATGPGGRMVGTLQGTVYDKNSDYYGDVFGNRTLSATLVGPTTTTTFEASCVTDTAITSSSGSSGTINEAP